MDNCQQGLTIHVPYFHLRPVQPWPHEEAPSPSSFQVSLACSASLACLRTSLHWCLSSQARGQPPAAVARVGWF